MPTSLCSTLLLVFIQQLQTRSMWSYWVIV